VNRDTLDDPYTLAGAASACLLALMAVGFLIGAALNGLAHTAHSTPTPSATRQHAAE
jgi:hypothetical protein